MFYFREEQQWSETVNTNDSDDEREQVYIQKGKIIWVIFYLLASIIELIFNLRVTHVQMS